MEADWGFGQAIDKISSSAGFDVYTGIPSAAVVIEAGTHGQGDDAIAGLRVATTEPDGRVGATVILRDAESGHGIPGHAGEAVPVSRQVAVAERHTWCLVDVVVGVPPWFVQTDVGRAGVQGWVIWQRCTSCICMVKRAIYRIYPTFMGLNPDWTLPLPVSGVLFPFSWYNYSCKLA